jgi:hypothetical protein
MDLTSSQKGGVAELKIAAEAAELGVAPQPVARLRRHDLQRRRDRRVRDVLP